MKPAQSRPTRADLADPDTRRELATAHAADRRTLAHYAERAALSLAADAVLRRPMAELVAELREKEAGRG